MRVTTILGCLLATACVETAVTSNACAQSAPSAAPLAFRQSPLYREGSRRVAGGSWMIVASQASWIVATSIAATPDGFGIDAVPTSVIYGVGLCGLIGGVWEIVGGAHQRHAARFGTAIGRSGVALTLTF